MKNKESVETDNNVHEVSDSATDSSATLADFQPYWEVPGGKGIKDLFTPRDISCMKKPKSNHGNVYLDDYENVKLNANMIFTFVKNGRMPPNTDRRWKKNRLRPFQQWMDNGCPKSPPSSMARDEAQDRSKS